MFNELWFLTLQLTFMQPYLTTQKNKKVRYSEATNLLKKRRIMLYNTCT